jgi:ribosome-associated protein
MDANTLAEVAVSALQDIKARDITVIDVSELTSLFERMIIASADSTRQTKALANNVQEKLHAHGATIYGVEGAEAGEWILVDAGDVIVHIMQPAVRQYYNLEELWGGQPPAPGRRESEYARTHRPHEYRAS